MNDLFDWNCPDADCLEIRNSFLRGEELSTRLDPSQQFIPATNIPLPFVSEQNSSINRNSEQLTVGALGANDLSPQGALPTGFVTAEATQRKYLEKFGKSITWEGRTLEVLDPGDQRLKGLKTSDEGGFYVIDPQFMRGTGLEKLPRYILEGDIINPPNRKLITMEELLKDSPKIKGAENLQDFWTKKGAPIVSSNSSYTPTSTTLPPRDYSQYISTEIDLNSMDIIGEQKISIEIPGLKDNTKRLSKEELLNRKISDLFASFPSEDKVAGVADFNQDGQQDILLRNTSTGEMQIWYMNGQNKLGEAPIIYGFNTPGSNWVIEGVGNFNNDNSPDIVWRDLAGGAIATWLMNNNTFVAAENFTQGTYYASVWPPMTASSNWRINAVADINNDQKDDLMWRDSNGTGTFIWFMDGTILWNAPYNAVQIQNIPALDANWKVVGAADFSGDGVKDMIWNNPVTGQTAYWRMKHANGPYVYTMDGGSFFPIVAPGWVAEAVRDVNNNGIPDIVWKSPDGSHWFWNLSSGNGTIAPSITSGERLPKNSEGSAATFNNGFNSEFGYGMINTSAAIAYLKNQAQQPEIFDSVAFNNSSNNSRQNEIVNLPEAWAQGYNGQGVTVAVIDSGVNAAHPDLVGTLWVNTGENPNDNLDNDNNGLINDNFGWDFVDNDNVPAPTTGDIHGTTVAGIIVAGEGIYEGRDMKGGAYKSKIMVLRVGDVDSSAIKTNTPKAIRYAADKGAKIINLSIASPLSVWTVAERTALESAITYARQKDVVIVIAAGNVGTATIDNTFPAILANNPGVIAVGATRAGIQDSSLGNNKASQVSTFSTGAGTTVRNYVVAPGEDVLTTAYNISGSYYILGQGTSLSAPLVAAAAATIRQAVPNANAAQIVNALVQTADSSDIYV
jgi:subtilisin family serine protease